MSVQECFLQYSKLGEKVFGTRRRFPHKAVSTERRLKNAVKRVIISMLGEEQENAPLLDPLGMETAVNRKISRKRSCIILLDFAISSPCDLFLS